MPGPFHRLESPSQTKSDALAQQQSMELWGAPGRNNSQSNLPCVKAYRSNLPNGQRGIEFDTHVAPTPNSGSPIEARWYDSSPGVRQHTDANGNDFAVIPLSRFVNGQP